MSLWARSRRSSTFDWNVESGCEANFLESFWKTVAIANSALT